MEWFQARARWHLGYRRFYSIGRRAMRLSDAIAMGRVLVIPRPEVILIDREHGCALGMGLAGSGFLATDFDIRGTKPYEALVKNWPWLESEAGSVPCQCGFLGRTWHFDVIGHIFDSHVVGDGRWTLDQLIDWIRSVEPAEDCESKETDCASTEPLSNGVTSTK